MCVWGRFFIAILNAVFLTLVYLVQEYFELRQQWRCSQHGVFGCRFRIICPPRNIVCGSIRNKSYLIFPLILYLFGRQCCVLQWMSCYILVLTFPNNTKLCGLFTIYHSIEPLVLSFFDLPLLVLPHLSSSYPSISPSFSNAQSCLFCGIFLLYFLLHFSVLEKRKGCRMTLSFITSSRQGKDGQRQKKTRQHKHKQDKSEQPVLPLFRSLSLTTSFSCAELPSSWSLSSCCLYRVPCSCCSLTGHLL
jgi:hypothetical protein